MRGYFGIGVEGLNKPVNLGTLMRTAHAFDASFVFTIASRYTQRRVNWTDTSVSANHVPLYEFETIGEFLLPKNCSLIGIELVEDAVELPSFRHPTLAAYVLGSERKGLSPALQERCDFMVKIPMKFCVNLGVAGAIVMYDRLMTTGKFAARPVTPHGGAEPVAEHVFGMSKQRRNEALEMRLPVATSDLLP